MVYHWPKWPALLAGCYAAWARGWSLRWPPWLARPAAGCNATRRPDERATRAASRAFRVREKERAPLRERRAGQTASPYFDYEALGNLDHFVLRPARRRRQRQYCALRAYVAAGVAELT